MEATEAAEKTREAPKAPVTFLDSPVGARMGKRFEESVSEEVKQSLTPQELKRQEIIHELITTERQYVNDLKLVVRVGSDYLFFQRTAPTGVLMT